MKLKFFYRIDNNKKEPILGSNVRRKSKPGRNWVEIIPICCNPPSLECSCGWRYFIQLDGLNKPVDGSLIKRKSWPKMQEGINYQEIQAPNCCALINWSISGIQSGSTGYLKIFDNGNLVVDQNVIPSDVFTGSFRPSKSNSEIIVIVYDGVNLTENLTITGGHVFAGTDTNVTPLQHTFTFNNKETNILGSI
jgi:hypothetical protein